MAVAAGNWLGVIRIRCVWTGTGSAGAAEELQVTLPHQGRSVFVPVRIPVCSERGRVSLSVRAIQARPGVPGYPMMP